MIIAFSAEENKNLDSIMSPHFGRCPFYVFVELDKDNKVKQVKTIENPYYNEHGPGVVPEFISKQKADVMISGGMGQRAVEFFNQFNIKVVTGATGSVKEALENFLNGKLQGYSPCKDGGQGNCH